MTAGDTTHGGKRRRRPEPSPALRALGLLVRREHSRPELARKLAARGVAADEAAAAIDKMTAAGWQDDTRFAISLARTRACNGYGPLRIRAELATHRLAPEAITAAFAALAEAGEDDWPALARDLVRRRLGTEVAVDARLRRKAADLLMRRGFDGDSMRAAIRQDTDD
jgi:regulatory protein